MLVLTRKLMEKLFIGDNICVTVVRLEGGQVRLGIEAPREISVVRAELVPDRQFNHGRHADAPAPTPGTPARPSPAPPNQVETGPNSPPRSELRTPPASAHENDSRRRGPSR
jgi:carbon storage regulator